MTGQIGNRNRSTHSAVRTLAQLALEAEGITSTAKGATPSKISDALDDPDAFAPDLVIDGVDVKVSSKLRPFRLAEDLESVTAGAALRNVPIAVVLQWRSERDIRDSYVVTSLGDFAKLLRGDHLT